MKLLSTIAFHFKRERLDYLRRVIAGQLRITRELDVFVVTNSSDADDLAQIRNLLEIQINVVSFVDLPNPWYLTWGHKQIMRDRFDQGYTHFIYTEDDIELLPANVDYWLRWREVLKPHGLYPSFVRVEFSNYMQRWVVTDLERPQSLSVAPKLMLAETDTGFLNFNNPYQGMFFYDRELMAEHLASPTSDVAACVGIRQDLPSWGGGVAERANLALTHENVPAGFHARNVVRFFERYRMLDPGAFVHHLPDNYANNPAIGLGKIPVDGVLSV